MRSGQNLKQLRITRSDELNCHYGFFLLPSLEYLEIDISKGLFIDGLNSLNHVSTWVKSLRGLKKLSIAECPLHVIEPGVLDELAEPHFPSLAEIDFKYVRTNYMRGFRRLFGAIS